MATTTTTTATATEIGGGGGGGDDADERRQYDKKKATRKEVRVALKALTEDEMASQSATITSHIVNTLPLFFMDKDTGSAAATMTTASGDAVVKLGLYVHCAKLREVDTNPLLRAALALPNVKLYVPIVDEVVATAGDPSVDAETTPTPTMRFLRITSLETDLEPKCMGILEPTETLSDGVTPRENLEGDDDTPLDLLLMPGLAFDTTGNRLGRGGGFYDAFIARYWARCEARGWAPPPTLALAYTQQVLAAGDVPMDPHDRPVDALATPDGIVGCTPVGSKLIGPSEIE